MTAAEERIDAMFHDLMKMSRANEPQIFCARIIALLANVVGNLPKDYFETMAKVEPCGRVGCDCHLGLQGTGKKLLRLLREDWENNKPEETRVA